MKHFGPQLCAVMIFCFASPAAADHHAGAKTKTAKPASPKPAPEMAQMRYFLGRWRCKGTITPPIPGRAPFKYSATSKMKLELNGHWMIEHFKQRKTKANPNPEASMFVYGYDAAKKLFRSVYINSSGARGDLSTPGWDGDKWIENGTLQAGPMQLKIRATFTKATKRKFGVLLEMQGPKGWVKVNEGECRK